MNALNFYCIYKKNDIRSEDLLQECINSATEFNLLVIPFAGIYTDIRSLINKKNLKINPLGKHKIKTDGVLGCFLSHFSLWQKCVNLNTPIGVCEYDAKFINGLPENTLEFFTDYLNLDYNRHLYLDKLDHDYKSIVVNDKTAFKVNALVETNIESKEKKPFKYINNNHIKGAFGYIIKPTGAKKLIEATQKFGILPADIQPNLYYCNIHYTTPSIVMLNPNSLTNRSKYSHTSNNNLL